MVSSTSHVLNAGVSSTVYEYNRHAAYLTTPPRERNPKGTPLSKPPRFAFPPALLRILSLLCVYPWSRSLMDSHLPLSLCYTRNLLSLLFSTISLTILPLYYFQNPFCSIPDSSLPVAPAWLSVSHTDAYPRIAHTKVFPCVKSVLLMIPVTA